VKVSLDQLEKRLTLHPEGLHEVLQRWGFVPLLPVLEHPLTEGAPWLQQLASRLFRPDFPWVEAPVQELLLWTLTDPSCPPSWPEKALDWIESGAAITPPIAVALEQFSSDKRHSQFLRHRARAQFAAWKLRGRALGA